MDPNPIKHIGTLVNRICIALEPTLIESGFRALPYDHRTQPIYRRWRDYQRGGDLLSISFFQHEAQLFAEYLTADAEQCVIITVPLGQPVSNISLVEKCDFFISEVAGLLRNLPECSHESH